MSTNRVLQALGLFCVTVLLLPGCGVFKSSPAWSTATSLNVPGRGNYEQSEAYARGVSSELTRHGIKNELVTFRYSVADDYNRSKVITRTSVIYRDETRPRYPWWLVDNLVRLPVWLPNGSVSEQVHFVTRYQPEILALNGQKLLDEVGASPKPLTAQSEREDLFYKENGTAYDSESSVDRRKMSTMQAPVASLH